MDKNLDLGINKPVLILTGFAMGAGAQSLLKGKTMKFKFPKIATLGGPATYVAQSAILWEMFKDDIMAGRETPAIKATALALMLEGPLVGTLAYKASPEFAASFAGANIANTLVALLSLATKDFSYMGINPKQTQALKAASQVVETSGLPMNLLYANTRL